MTKPKPRPAAASERNAVNLKDQTPFELLRYERTPTLVWSLAQAHRAAGGISAMRFGYYAQKRLEAQALRTRIGEFVAAAGQHATREEVANVLAGNILPPRRTLAQQFIRRAAILAEAISNTSERNTVTTPATFAVYREISRHDGASLPWSRFAGRDRTLLLGEYRDRAKPVHEVSRVYEWLAADELLGKDGLLRAALLHWALHELFRACHTDKMAIAAAVAHELRAGGFDHSGLFVLSEYQHGRKALALGGGMHLASKARGSGDLTPMLEFFCSQSALALMAHARQLDRVRDSEDRVPWLVVAPPDQMDRRILEAVEKRGSARSPVILEALVDPKPPLRTLQRRLQKLVHDGLLVKHGTRKDAFYQVGEGT
jgi:hypothetical protein